MINDVEFANEYIFIVAIVLAIVGVAFWFWWKKDKKQVALRIPFYDDLIQAQKKVGRFYLQNILRWFRYLCFVGAVILLVIALARPQKVTEDKKMSKNGVDILIALDVSESMLAEDLQPNRIEAAKKYISDFIAGLKSDRVGLEVFAGKPFTQSPLSFDYNVVRYYLSEISTDTIDQQRDGLGGTAIGDAIVSAINRFNNDKDRTKVLILLTDGEANVGVDPVIAAEDARSKGIKIYTIGIGKKEGAPLPIIQNGQKVYARNPDGTIYKTKFDEKTLKDIAGVSGGEYFYAGDNNSLEKSLKTIDALEKTEYETQTTVKKEDEFFGFLFSGFLVGSLGIFLLFISNIVNNKQKKI